jgi:hypothetical protein
MPRKKKAPLAAAAPMRSMPGMSELLPELFAAVDPKVRRAVRLDHYREKANQLFLQIAGDPELGNKSEEEAYRIFASYAQALRPHQRSRINKAIALDYYDSWKRGSLAWYTGNAGNEDFYRWLASPANKFLFPFGQPTIQSIRGWLRPGKQYGKF